MRWSADAAAWLAKRDVRVLPQDVLQDAVNNYATPENLELLSEILRQACACGRPGWKCDPVWHDLWHTFNVGGTPG